MTDLAWIIFAATIIALAAIEVVRVCRRARRRPDPTDMMGADRP